MNPEMLAEFCRRWGITPEEAHEWNMVLWIVMRADPLKLSEFKARRLLGDETVNAWKQEAAWQPTSGSTGTGE
jgi:hypothetical protein